LEKTAATVKSVVCPDGQSECPVPLDNMAAAPFPMLSVAVMELIVAPLAIPVMSLLVPVARELRKLLGWRKQLPR
jgi:hypothetical protein